MFFVALAGRTPKAGSKAPARQPSARVRGSSGNAEIKATAMEGVEECHLNSVLKEIDADQFNDCVLQNISHMDKVETGRSHNMCRALRFANVQRSAYGLRAMTEDVVGFLSGIHAESRPPARHRRLAYVETILRA